LESGGTDAHAFSRQGCGGGLSRRHGLTSATPDGAKTLNEYKAFDIRFNKRDRTHKELLEWGTGSAMMMELK